MTNGKLPFFAFYPKDFWSDPKVLAMNYEQVGMYFKLLSVAWEQRQPGTLPCDDDVLAKYLGLLKEYWLHHRDTVMAAFCFEDGRWYQKRLVAEYEKAHALRQKRSTAGRKGNQKRWPEKNGDLRLVCDRNAIAINSLSSSNSSEKGVRGKNGRTGPLMTKEKLLELQANPAYKQIDVTAEGWKFKNWCSEHRKPPTSKRFVNWLNNVH